MRTSPTRGVTVHAYRNGYRVRWRQDGRSRSSRVYPFSEEAERFADTIRQEKIARSQTIGSAWDEYVLDRRADGVREGSLATIRADVDRVLLDVWDEPIVALTPHRAGSLYASATRGFAAGTHQRSLITCRAFYAFCVRKKWLKANPFADVRSVGRRADHRGESLRRNEASDFRERCVELARGGDLGAFACLVTLMVSLRPSETIQLEARDVDADGTILWIDGEVLKTETTRRQVEIVDPDLRDLLVQYAAGKAPHDRLVPRSRHFVARAAKRIGGVELNARYLRHTHSTLAARVAESLSDVAFGMGHGTDSRVAKQHYIAPGTVESARSARVAASLQRSRK